LGPVRREKTMEKGSGAALGSRLIDQTCGGKGKQRGGGKHERMVGRKMGNVEGG